MFPNVNLVYYDFLSFLWKLCKDTFSLYKFVANFYCYSSYLKHKNTINLTSPKQYIYYLQSEKKRTNKIFLFSYEFVKTLLIKPLFRFLKFFSLFLSFLSFLIRFLLSEFSDLQLRHQQQKKDICDVIIKFFDVTI